MKFNTKVYKYIDLIQISEILQKEKHYLAKYTLNNVRTLILPFLTTI